MKQHYKILAIICLVGGLALAAGGQKGPNAETIFSRADQNGDGKVTPEELPNPETFATFDLNKDGIITLDEARQVIGKIAAGSVTLPSAANTEATPTETSTPERIFDYLDKNKDGVLTDDELSQQAKRLKALDRNKDGKITRAEAIEGIKEYQEKKGLTLPSTPGGASEPAKSVVIGPDVVKGSDLGVGRQLPDISFTTLDGKAVRLGDLASPKGVVIAFTSTTCPVSQRYMPTLARLQKELADQGLALLVVNPFAGETDDAIHAELSQHHLTGPCVHDANKALATALRARTTTEVFLVDATRTLLYRGAIDDQYGLNYNLDAPRQCYLTDAVTSMLAGALPHVAATAAPGCELDIPAEKQPRPLR